MDGRSCQGLGPVERVGFVSAWGCRRCGRLGVFAASGLVGCVGLWVVLVVSSVMMRQDERSRFVLVHAGDGTCGVASLVSVNR